MLISPEYLEQQKKLHENPNYGVASIEMGPIVSDIINGMQYYDVLDYGCGKGRLAGALTVDHDVALGQYDPAVERFAAKPEPHSLVVCVDVLEHIEPECLDDVLADLKRVTLEQVFMSVACGPAQKVLSDGRNAHLIQEPPIWWLNKLSGYFALQIFQRLPHDRFFVVMDNGSG